MTSSIGVSRDGINVRQVARGRGSGPVCDVPVDPRHLDRYLRHIGATACIVNLAASGAQHLREVFQAAKSFRSPECQKWRPPWSL